MNSITIGKDLEVLVDDLEVKFLYDSSEDKVEMKASRDLTHMDIIMLLSNILILLKEEDQIIAASIALQTAKQLNILSPEQNTSVQ